MVYNGKASSNPVILAASAAVVDAYAMFLTGPFYLMETDAKVVMAEPAQVDGHVCDQILAILKPGFGISTEDRVLVAIDRKTRLVRRLRFSFEALESTRGVVADVLLRDHKKMNGVVWPTRFEEILQRPFPLLVHRWHLTGFEGNCDMLVDDLKVPLFNDRAARPARPLPWPAPAPAGR